MKFLAKKPLLVLFLLTLFFLVFFDLILRIDDSFIRTGLAAAFATILSPRKKKIKTQIGEKTQITWFLLKGPIFLD